MRVAVGAGCADDNDDDDEPRGLITTSEWSAVLHAEDKRFDE